MSKGQKIGLAIGIPLLILVLIFGYYIVNNSGSSMSGLSYDYEEMYMEDGDVGYDLAIAPEGNFSGKEVEKSVRYDATPASSPQMTNGITPTSATDEAAQERLIVKTANMSVVVENVRAAVNSITQYAEEHGGFVVSSDVSKSGLALYGNITIRIPVDTFDTGIEDIKTYGEVVSQRVDGQDVTEEYVDLDAQIKNLRATEEQFLVIMKKATEIEDILAVQRELSYVRSDIERIEGRMKYLRQSADLSTLSVHLSTDPDVLPAWDEEDQWKPWAQVKEAFRSLVDMGQGLVNLLIWIVVYIPLWAVLGLIVWLVIRIVKRKRHVE